MSVSQLRKFKFRVWKDERMCPLDHYLPASQALLLEKPYPQQGVVLMQWTGLVDKLGVEIFEGDVVEAESEGTRGTYEVLWRQEDSPGWILYPAYQGNNFWYFFGRLNAQGQMQDDGIKVIGNVYQHPDKASWRSSGPAQ